MKEKYLSWRIKLEKKSYTVVCREINAITRGLGEKILTQTKSPIPPPPPSLKCQMVGPLVRNKPGIKPVENGSPEELTLEIITLNSRRSIY